MRFHEHIKGDKAEYIAAMWLWDQGYLVCRNMSQQGAVDLVAIKAVSYTHLTLPTILLV